jgi:hypothetical protein
MITYITWTADDVTHSGELLNETDTTITFKTSYGVFTIPIDDGTFVKTNEKPLVEVVKTPVEHEVNLTPKEGSKMAHAIIIFNRMIGASRKNVIAAFVGEIGMTEGGASTYYSTIKKNS